MSKTMVDVSEISEMLSVSPRTVWRMRDSGRMPGSIAIGRLIRWRLSDIEEWIREGCPDLKFRPERTPRATAEPAAGDHNPAPAGRRPRTFDDYMFSAPPEED